MDQTGLFLLPHLLSRTYLEMLEYLHLILHAALDTDLDFYSLNSTAHWTLLVLPCESRSREALGHKHRNTR